MAENESNFASTPGNQGDNTAPPEIQSPGTFVPLTQEPHSVNSKTDLGKSGKD
jgi:hypothetical protein